MMVVGSSLRASTSRRRSWLTLQRLPAPARLGARSPWNLVSGNGPEWQRMQVDVRSSTSARPRAGSPGAPVSEAGMPSPATLYDASACARAWPNRAQPTAIAQAIWWSDLAKGIRRQCCVPGLCVVGLLRAQLARRIEGTGCIAVDLGKDIVLRSIDTRERKGVVGRDDVVADAG